jgi:HK97 family phage major capsid protein
MNPTAPKPATTIKPGTTLQRAFSVERSAVNEELRTVELAFASEQPYERWWGVEVLDCTATAMRMGRLTSGGPLLCDHNTKDHIGVIESVQLGADRVARAVVRFGKSARAEEVFRDVVDGIRRNVSVGYQIHQAVLVETKDNKETYRVSDWEPYEISLVSVPADASVGVGRSAQDVSPVIEITPHFLKESTVTTATPVSETQAAAPAAAPAITSADVRAQVAAERNQVREMVAIGEMHERFGGNKIAKEAIEKGQTVDELRALILNAVTAAQTTQATHLDLSKGDQKRFSVFKAIRALADKNWKDAGFELECHEEILKRTGLKEAVHSGFYMPMDIQRRDLTVGTASAGGNLVATDLQASNFIDLLRAKSRLAQLGATMLPGLVGNLAVPKLTGAATGFWLTNEATAITESQQTIGQLAMSPKTLGAYTELSRLLLLQSTPAAESMVMNDLAKVLALAIDLAGFEGSGSSGQPTGISATAGIGAVTGTSLALAGIIEFQTDVAASNALDLGSSYLTTPAVAGLLKGRARIASTDSKTLWEGNILEGTVDGFRAVTTTQLTAASMIFGDFSQVVIGEWGMLEIALNPYASFASAITGIRAIQSVDVGVRQAAAFSRATSIT